MAKQIHVHVHTRDAFEESQHPRGEGGKFTAGSAMSHHMRMSEYHMKQRSAGGGAEHEQAAADHEHVARAYFMAKRSGSSADLAQAHRHAARANTQSAIAEEKEGTPATRVKKPKPSY